MNLKEKFAFLEERPAKDCPAYNCPAGHLVNLMQALRDQHGYSMLVDLTAVDEGPGQMPRFIAVYHLFNLESFEYLRIASACEGDENVPEIPTVSHIWAGADWHERECFDMFGIRFKGHPDLRRILMWDEYPYYPLRKEFPLAGFDMDFQAADVAERTGVRIQPAPMAGGPFVSGDEGPMSEKEPRAKDQSWREQHKKPGGSGPV